MFAKWKTGISLFDPITDELHRWFSLVQLSIIILNQQVQNFETILILWNCYFHHVILVPQCIFNWSSFSQVNKYRNSVWIICESKIKHIKACFFRLISCSFSYLIAFYWIIFIPYITSFSVGIWCHKKEDRFWISFLNKLKQKQISFY